MHNYDDCIDDCAEVMKELKKFEERYEVKVQEYELDKLSNKNMLKELSKDVASLRSTAADLSTALQNHMKDEEKHHLTVALALTKIETSLESRPTHQDLGTTNQEVEKQKGRITTIWIIGSVVASVVLAVLLGTAIYIKNDVVETIKAANQLHRDVEDLEWYRKGDR